MPNLWMEKPEGRAPELGPGTWRDEQSRSLEVNSESCHGPIIRAMVEEGRVVLNDNISFLQKSMGNTFFLSDF